MRRSLVERGPGTYSIHSLRREASQDLRGRGEYGTSAGQSRTSLVANLALDWYRDWYGMEPRSNSGLALELLGGPKS